MKFYPIVYQKQINDCGLACIYTVCKYYGISINECEIKKGIVLSSAGISVWDMRIMLKRVGFSSKAIYVLSVHDLEEKTPFIAVIKRNNSHLHYVIIYEVNKDDVCIADPYFGILSVKMDNFYNCFSNMIILIYK